MRSHRFEMEGFDKVRACLMDFAAQNFANFSLLRRRAEAQYFLDRGTASSASPGKLVFERSVV